MGLKNGLLAQLTRGVWFEIHRVALVGVDVNLQFETLIHTNEHLVKRHRARPADLQLHAVPCRHAVMRCIFRMHVHVSLGADDAVRHLKESLRAHQHTARCALNLARLSQRDIEAKRDRVRVGQLHLVQRPARAKDA